MENVVSLDGDEVATGHQLAVDIFVKVREEGMPKLAAARYAAQALMDDFEDGTRLENTAELIGFLDQLFEILM